MEETINIPLYVVLGIELYLNTNQKVENLVLTINNCSSFQNEDKREANYLHSPIGKPEVASDAIYAMFVHLLQINGMEDVQNQVYEPMVQTHLIPVPNHHDPLENIEEDPKVYEHLGKRDGKRIV